MTKILFLSATPLESIGREILDYPIIYTGVGKINAAMTTADAILSLTPDLIINFGSCGSLQNIEPGRILKVGTVYNDIDCSPLSPYGHTPFSGFKEIQFENKSNVKCITTDRFYDKNRKDYSKNFKDIVKKMDIIDMELYAIAQVCQNWGVQLMSYKWVSDDGDMESWEENSKIGFEKFKEKIIPFLESL